MAALYGNAKSKQWCSDNGVPIIRDAHTEGTNSTGGYLVPVTMENSIIDLRDSYGIVRQTVRVIPMSSNYVTMPKRLTGLSAAPVAESGTITESTKSWGQLSLTAKKWGVITRYSSEISEDAVIGIAQDLTQEIAYAFAIAEDNALFLGDGTSTYHGIVGLYRKFFDANVGTFIGAPSAAATHNTLAEVDADDLDTLMATLPAYARRGAQFWVSPQGKSLIFDPLLRAAGGNTQGDLAAGMPPRYLGHPINEVVALSAVASTDYDEKPILYFGDISQAVIMGTRRGITLATSSDIYFTTDEIAIRGTERFDINVHSIGDATTAGPLVALIGESS
jgi:HK97 family phage major capsid protein